MRPRHAFTLLELLVMVAIIGVSGFLVISASLRAKEKARRAACAGNLQLLGMATEQYAGEFRSRAPYRKSSQATDTPPVTLSPALLDNVEAAYWLGNLKTRVACGRNSVFANVALMSQYVHSPTTLVCPGSGKQPAHDFSSSNANDAANVSYTQQVPSANPRTGLFGMLTTTGGVFHENPDMVLFWDQGVAGNPCGPTGGIGLSWARTSSHGRAGGNVLFNDGHVAFHTTTPTNMPLGCLNP